MEHRFDYLLKDVIGHVKDDYAGFEEKKDLHDSPYFVNAAGSAWKRGNLDELLFLRYTSEYLASLQDPNLKLIMLDHDDYKNYDAGFRVRRFGDDLYVTEADAEDRVQPGDKITQINRRSPGEHQRKFGKNFLIGTTPEREQWGGILKMGKHFLVEHQNGETEDLKFKHYPLRTHNYAPEFEALSPSTCKITVKEFTAGGQELAQLVASHYAELRSCEKLILDLRWNAGGDESGFLPLFPLVIDEPTTESALLDQDPIYNNYTKYNCTAKVTEFKALQMVCRRQNDPDTYAVLDSLIDEIKQKSGSGLTLDPFEPADPDEQPLEPYSNIGQVVIITDTWCRDAGERFVYLVRGMKKVTLLGRPTMGTVDYTNFVTTVMDDTYTLSYPMGKRAHVVEGTCYSETGLPVDVEVPWTPDECTQDILLQKALEL